MIEIDVINSLINIINSLNNFTVNYTNKTQVNKCNVEVYLLDNNNNLIINYENANYSNNRAVLGLVFICKMIIPKGANFELNALSKQYEYANILKYALSTSVIEIDTNYDINENISLNILSGGLTNINTQYTTIENNEMIFSLTTNYEYDYRYINNE